MRVEVAYAGPEGEAIETVDVPEGSCVADALARATLVARLDLALDRLALGIHGERASAGTPLREGDRVELLRPLRADPKEARRSRAAAKPLSRPRPRRRLPKTKR